MSIRMSNSNGAACIWMWRQASNPDLDGCLSGFRVNATGPRGSGRLLPHAVSVSHWLVTTLRSPWRTAASETPKLMIYCYWPASKSDVFTTLQYSPSRLAKDME